MVDFCQILTIFGKFTEIRKTPNKWWVRLHKNDPGGGRPPPDHGDLGSKKSQNALKTGGEVDKKQNV